MALCGVLSGSWAATQDIQYPPFYQPAPTAHEPQNSQIPNLALPAGMAAPQNASPEPLPSPEPLIDDAPREHAPKRPPRPEPPPSAGETAVGTLGFLVFGMPTLPFWAPGALLHDQSEEDAAFPAYPYDRVPGYMMIGAHPSDPESLSPGDMLQRLETKPDDDTCESDAAISLEPWKPEPRTSAGRLDLEYGSQLAGMDRAAAHLLMSNADRWCNEIQWNYIQQRAPAGPYDKFQLGDYNMEYRFAQGQRAEFRAGVGFNWLKDDHDTTFGINFTYGADFYPAKPWVVSTVIDWGLLGRTDLFRGRCTVGLLWGGCEFYTGYEYLEIERTSMSNLIGGIRLWF